MSELRLLAQDSSHGYTSRFSDAMPFEPEAISADEQKVISSQARQVFEIGRAEELARAATRSRCNRLRELEGEARRRMIDPTRAIAEIERGMAILEQLVRGTAFRGTA